MSRCRCKAGWLLFASAAFLCTSPAALARPRLVLKLGHGLPTTHAVHKAMLFMADRVKARSEGQMVVQVFPNEQLGKEMEVIGNIHEQQS